MCDCYKIGGPWIAEDPNCPVHGTQAQRKRDEASDLRKRIIKADNISDLKNLMIELLDLIEE